MIRFLIRVLAICLIILPNYCFSMDVVGSDLSTIISTNRILRIVGNIDEETVRRFEEQFYSSLSRDGDILILINSGGGYVEAGSRIIKFINIIKRTTKVVCVAEYNTSSMAFNILSNCNVRTSLFETRMIVHKVAHLPNCKDNSIRYTAKYMRELADGLDDDDIPYRTLNSKLMNISTSAYDVFAEQETEWSPLTLVRKGYLKDIVTILDKAKEVSK